MFVYGNLCSNCRDVFLTLKGIAWRLKKVSEYDQERPQSQTADEPGHREEEPHNNHETQDKQSKETSSFFPIEMIAKLELTQSNAQQNIEQLQNPTLGVTINNESTKTEPPPKNGQQPKPRGA